MDREEIKLLLCLEHALDTRIQCIRDLVTPHYADKIFALYETICSCNGTIYVCGNGGSALTAQHWALHLYEMGKDVRCLVDNVGLITAIANDTNYEDIFWSQMRNACSDDLLIIISGSGLSSNIEALGRLKVLPKDMRKIGIFAQVKPDRIDYDETHKLRERCDLLIDLPTAEYGTAEDMHLLLIHVLLELRAARG